MSAQQPMTAGERLGPTGALARLIDQGQELTGVHCPMCESASNGVKDSRPARLGSVRRRRQCRDCGFRWTTFEIRESVFGSIDKIVTLDEQLRALGEDDFNLIHEIVALLWRRRDRRL